MSRFSPMVKLLSHSVEVGEGLAPRHRDLAGRCVIVSGKVGDRRGVHEGDEEDENRRKRRQFFSMRKSSIDSPWKRL